jgi:multiple sugar transport system permease protein
MTALPRPNTKPSGRGRRGSRARHEARWFYLFIGPWLLGFVCLSLFPLIFALFISFTNYDGLNLATVKFLGLGNYLRALQDRNAIFALQRTATFTLMSVPLNLLSSFCIALLLTRERLRARGVFRTLFYLPSIIPIVAVVWIWRLIMDRNFGLVNGVLSMIRPGTAVAWLVDYPTMVLIIMSLWIGTGGAMIIFMAGLQGVPKELEEAALIDGANVFQMFRSITLPLVTPVVFYQLILGIIFSLQILIEPILLTGIGSTNQIMASMPPRPNYMYMVHVYNQIFSNQRFGYGAALLWLLFLLTLALTLIVFRTSRYWVYYEVEQEGART